MKRGRYREITVDPGAGESVVNPDDWPTVDLKPSKGSAKGQRYVGPGGEKKDNLGELSVRVRTERHGWDDSSSRVTYQGGQGPRSCLLCQECLTKVTLWSWMEVDLSHFQTGVQVWPL